MQLSYLQSIKIVTIVFLSFHSKRLIFKNKFKVFLKYQLHVFHQLHHATITVIYSSKFCTYERNLTREIELQIDSFGEYKYIS